jgi:hypothetical protein
MKRLSMAAILSLVLGVSSFGQPAEMVGTWKMDASRSRFFGAAGAPTNVVIRYERENNLLRETLIVVNSAGAVTTRINYALDGTELVNDNEGEQIKSRLGHEQDSLSLQWLDEGGAFTRRLTFSKDYRTMTIRVHDSDPNGEPEDVIVLSKQ